jgi:hypothetical protein
VKTSTFDVSAKVASFATLRAAIATLNLFFKRRYVRDELNPGPAPTI